MTNLIRTLAIASLLIAILISSPYLFRDQILLMVGNYLMAQDNLSPADVVHVIAGEDYRTDYAIQLYKRGLANQIFFTGGWCNTGQYYHGQHGRERALSQGVPEAAIALDDSPVTSTYNEAERLAAFIGRSHDPIKSVIVVSDPFHMRRARWTYQRVLGKDIAVYMASVPFEQTPYQQRWWEDRLSRAYVKEEYEKIVYYVARYQLSWGPVKYWLSSLDRE